MTTVKIDDVEYDYDKLNDAAKAQINSLQFVDSEITRKKMQLAALQTARNTYSRILKQELESQAGDDQELLDIDSLDGSIEFD